MDLSGLSSSDLKAIASGNMGAVSTEGLKAIAAQAPQAPEKPKQSAPVQPAPERSWMDTATAGAQNVSQGATMGWGDEIGNAIAKPIAYGLKNMLPASMGGEDVSYDQVSNWADRNKANVMSPMTDFNREHPVIGGLEQAAGAIPAMAGLSGFLKSAAPEVSGALQKFAETSPYWASAGAGGATGALYGAGAADEGNRTEGAVVGGLGGAALGVAANYIGRNVLSPLAKKTGSALQDFLRSSEDAAGSEAPTVPSAPVESPEISNITNEPLNAATDNVTGKLPLSPGVAAKDPNLLRVEESARQGLLGRDAQAQINKSDADVAQGARTAMQSLKGVTNKDSDSILSDAVKQFQDQANIVKKGAQDLYAQRDTAMADAVLNKSKVGPSLGGSLNDVVNDPKNIAGFKSKSGAPARQLYQDFKDLITGTKGREIPFSDLAAWRSDVANLATTDQSTAGTMAKRLGSAYDNWMDNITQDHFVSGDPNAASLARQASSAWKNYKTLFGSENSPVISGMVKPYDATPADFVDKVFGANIAGNGNTALNMRKMTAALPEEAQQPFKDNVFRGLVSKVFEGANGDNLQLGKLRDNLQKLQGSQVYKENFSEDAAKHDVITNLISDLTQHIQQIGRRDVYSPSGGAVIRGMKNLISGAAETPLINKIPGVKLTDAVVNKAADLSQHSMDRATFNTAMKGVAKAAQEAASAEPVLDFNTLKAGILGGISAPQVLDVKNKGAKK